MRNHYLKMACLISCAFFINAALAGNPKSSGGTAFKMPSGVTSKDYLPNTVIVKVRPEYRSACIGNEIIIPSLRTVNSALGIVSTVKKFSWATQPAQERNAAGQPYADLSLIYELKYTGNSNIEYVINQLLSTGLFVYAEPHYIYPLDDFYPSDPDTSGTRNYYLELTKAYQAWSVSKGDTSVVIAIIDSGSDLDHPDLAANFAKNYADPVDGIDNDNDGYTDNFIGWDLGGADYENIVEDNDAGIKGANNNHGSHVSGDASAVTDNGIGVSGIGFKCRLLPVKCAADNDTRSSGSGYIISGYEGITYAANHGAHIINCSWGGTGGGGFGQDVIDYATINKGALVVAAAGNSGNQESHYPSSYNYVLSVASTNSSDKKSSFSNYGYDIDLCAPGTGIYSTVFNNGYASFDGTSMSSPIAAGAAGIVKAVFPAYTGLQVGEQLRVTCDNVDPVNIGTYKGKLGSGRVNLYKAITINNLPSIRSVNQVYEDKNNGAFLPGDTIKMFSDFLNYLAPSTAGLKVTLSTTSSKVTILSNVINIGSVATLQTATGFNPFTIAIKNTVTENEVIVFKLTYEDAAVSYTDFQYVKIVMNLSSLDITVNEIASTETSIGRVGYRNGDATGGLGFVFKGQNLLYEASLMAGNSSTKVSNNARGVSVPDEHFVSTTRASKVENGLADFESEGNFNDNGAATNKLNISVNHKAFAWSVAPHTRYIMFKHKIFNNGTADLSSTYYGYFADFDIGGGATEIGQNRSGFDATNRMGYVFYTGTNGYYAAIRVLSTDAPATYHSMSNQSTVGTINMSDGFSPAEKYTALSTVGPNAGESGSGEDVMITVGTGPYTIPPGGYVNAAFAFIAGENLADIQASGQAAQNKYDEIAIGISFEDLYRFELDPVYPNPASDQATISFSLPKEGKVKLTLYNSLGQVIRTVLQSELVAGPYSIDLELEDLESGMYFYSLEFNGMLQTKKFSIQR